MNEEPKNCLICEGKLTTGYLESGHLIKWINDSDHFITKLLTIGEAIGEGLSVKGNYCPNCKQITLNNIEIE
ncbi:hypothetical protein LNTAR_19282 [Lentisphaera araneosa HTCC2155]|uniref:DUF6487 domain-containing protein n=1 Tax=Lentisphaera araneosa HTCC2155 TaxID=313628 RepID=A6DQS2_9BACT|nr:PF20097 family protein [Lentisphaera araneosa]EDM25972.1 hypothetical protein LNTAR_19282 [Lentisphaera araneosa HTCC2155]